MNSRFLSFQVLIYWMDFQWVMGMKKGQPRMKLSPCAESWNIIEPLLRISKELLSLWNGCWKSLDVKKVNEYSA